MSHYLWALIFFSAVPLFCFLGYTVTTTSLAEAKRFEDLGEDTADKIARKLDLEWARLEAGLLVLADSPSLKKRNLAGFESDARDFGRHNGANAVLIEPDGNLVTNARAEPWGPSGKLPNAPLVQEVLRTGRPLVIDAFRAALDGEARVGSVVPVRTDGGPELALAATWTLDDLARQLDGIEIPAGWLASVIDSQGVRLWRNKNPELIGKPVNPAIVAAVRSRQAHRLETVSREGVPLVVFRQPMQTANWTVFVGIPKDELNAPFQRSVVMLSTLAALVLALGLAIASVIMRRLGRAIETVEAGTVRLGQGEEPGAIDAKIRELHGLERAIQEAGRQRATAENALRASEARFRGAIEGLLDAFEILSPVYDAAGRLADLRFEYINRVGATMAGKPADELVGQLSRAMFPASAWERLAPGFERVLRSGEPLIADSFPFLPPSAGNEGVFIDLRAWLLDDKLAVTWRSVSHRIRMERALRDSELRLKRAQAMAHLGSWELDLSRDELTWSDEIYRIFGLQPEESAPTYKTFLDVVHPEDRAAVDATYVRALTERRDSFEIDHRIVRKTSGEIRYVHERCEQVRGPSGRIVRSVGMVHDITDRMHAELALRQAKAEAERANEAKSRFLAAASHDLRQPLSALALYVGVLKNKLGPNDATLHENMKDCVGSLSELLTDLLDVSKLDAGVVRPNPADFSIAELLARVVSTHAPEAELKRLRLRSVACRRVGHTDPVLFSRMLGNLVDNAIRYTRRGGVLVGCRRRAGKLWVEVWDTGIGIVEGHIGEIFDEFRQLANDERSRGSGLGLAIVAKTAALLGLQLRVQSRPGKGSMFALELPLGQAVRATERNEETDRGNVRIALVEDNASLLEALALSLQEVGHDVIAAPNGRLLMAELGDRAPDIVISDYRVGNGETGFDVITGVRLAFGNSLPAVIITGDTDPKLMRSMADRGILVQHKPVDIETLQSCIASATSGATA